MKSSPDVKYRIENSKISSTFTIEKVNRSDSGNYSCLVKNGVGSDSKNILLTVKGNLNSYLLLIFCTNRWRNSVHKLLDE